MHACGRAELKYKLNHFSGDDVIYHQKGMFQSNLGIMVTELKNLSLKLDYVIGTSCAFAVVGYFAAGGVLVLIICMTLPNF